MQIVLAILALNCVSFVIVRQWLYRHGRLAAKMEVVQKGELLNSNAVVAINFLMAGNLNQPKAAFQFLESELQGWVIHANFRMIGYNAKDTASAIIRMIIDYLYPDQVKIWTISLSDHVARYVEDWPCGDIEIIAINPCTDVSFLRKPLGTLLKIGAPILEIICHLLGWISVIPLIPTVGGRYSLVLLADQYWSIAYDKPPARIDRTTGVVCSHLDGADHDGLLENEQIREYFREHRSARYRPVQIVDINTGHGNTIGAAEAYRAGVKRIHLWHS